MDRDRREALRRKYLRLGLGELAAAAVFCAVAVFLLTPRLLDERGVRALWSALIPLLLVLVQAGAFWLLARGWVGRAPMPASLGNAFRAFRILDIGALTLGLVGVLIWMPDGIGWGAVVSAVWLFGVIEYLNYFVVRLSYPPAQWPRRIGRWRRPQLVQDLDRSAR